MTFQIQRFTEIPKIIGRGAKPGSGRPSLYPFADMKEEGDGFVYESILDKKVRAAVQAYRQNHPKYKFAQRPLRHPEFLEDGVTAHPEANKLNGNSAVILIKILTDEEYNTHVKEREATKRAQEQAQVNGTAPLHGKAAQAPQPQANGVNQGPAPVVAASVDDALSGLNFN